MKLGQAAATPTQSTAFTKKYRAEMTTLDTSPTLDVLAALSKTSDFSVGCYCKDEAHCHRSLLHALLTERGPSARRRERPGERQRRVARRLSTTRFHPGAHSPRVGDPG